MAESKGGLWFLAGLGLGVLAGILYAPQSGEETREMIARKASRGKDLLQRKSSEMRQQAGQFAERGKQVVSRQFDQFQAAVEAGKQAYRESANAEGDSGTYRQG